MKGKFVYVIVPSILFLTVLCISIYGYLRGVTDQDSHTISVIVESNNKEGFTILKQGIESACEAYHAEINLIVLSDYNDIGEYVKVIQREIQKGTEGFLLNIQYNERLAVKLDEIMTQKEVVLLESEIPMSMGYTFIAPDNYQMGFDLGEKMKQDLTDGEQIGVIGGSNGNLADMDRRKGIEEALSNFHIEWVEFDEKKPLYAERINASSIHKYVTLNNNSTEMLSDIIKDGSDKKSIYGVGNSEKTVYYLDRGIIRQLAVPNEYMMGYMGIKAICDRLNYMPQEDQINIDYTLVNKETLYEEENQKLLFPIVQ